MRLLLLTTPLFDGLPVKRKQQTERFSLLQYQSNRARCKMRISTFCSAPIAVRISGRLAISFLEDGGSILTSEISAVPPTIPERA